MSVPGTEEHVNTDLITLTRSVAWPRCARARVRALTEARGAGMS
jgi:hypothetical protein